MGYWSKAKKKGRRFARMKVNHYRRGIRGTRRLNNEYDVVGLTPDHLVSPIDFVPYFNIANKGYRGYKVVRTSNKVRKTRKRNVRAVKSTYRAKSRGRSLNSPNRRSKTSRRSPSGRYYKRRRRYY